MGPEAEIPEPVSRWFKLERRLQWKTRVHDLHTYPCRVRDGAIEVDV
jgi:nitrite reductase/ring-hydroxylating ferredoxin subunit